MFSRFVMLFFALIAGGFAYATVYVDENYAIWMVVPIIFFAMAFIFGNQIDWWWNGRKPKEIDEKMKQILMKHSVFYNNLSLHNKMVFRQRMKAYMIGNSFMAQGGMTGVMEDMKGIIAASAVQLTFGTQENLISKFENIILYPNAFPSPQFPTQFHPSETFEEDGVIMFSLKHLFKNFEEPDRYYNIALYEFAKIFRSINPQISFPEFDESTWLDNEKITGHTKEKLFEYFNLDDVDVTAVMVVSLFTHPDKFKSQLPRVYERFMDIFNLDLVESANPVIRAI